MALDHPLKLKNSIGHLQYLDSDEMNYIAYLVGDHLKNTTEGSLNNTTGADWLTIGSAVDTYYNESDGTHPASLITSTTTTYNIKQNTVVASLTDSDYRLPVGFEDSNNTIHEMNSTNFTSFTDEINSRILKNEYISSFRLADSDNPPGADWDIHYNTIYSDTINDDLVKNYHIYIRNRMTAPSSIVDSDGSRSSIVCIQRSNGDSGTYEGLTSMTDRQIQQTIGQYAATRRGNNPSGGSYTIGNYKLLDNDLGTPYSLGYNGTWEQRGTLENTRKVVSDNSYTRTRASTYTREFTRNSLRNSLNTFSRTSTLAFLGNYTRERSSAYTRTRTSNYAGDYTGNYQRTSVGIYTRDRSSTYTRDRVSTYTTNFTRDFSAAYTRDAYKPSIITDTGYYTGNYTSNYTRTSTRTSIITRFSAYASYYSRNFTRVSTGYYSRTRVSTYAGNFTGNYTRISVRYRSSGYARGPFTRESTVSYLGNYLRNIVSTSILDKDYTRVSHDASGNEFTVPFTRIRWSAGYYAGEIKGIVYQGVYIGNYSSGPEYIGNYIGASDGTVPDYGAVANNYTRVSSYTRTIDVNSEYDYSGASYIGFVANYTGAAYARTVVTAQAYFRTAFYLGNYTKYNQYSYVGANVFTGLFIGNYIANFLGNYTRTSTRQRIRYDPEVGTYYYIGNYTSEYLRDTLYGHFTRTSTRQRIYYDPEVGTYYYIGNFVGDYTNTVPYDYTGDYFGHYFGTEQLYVRYYTRTSGIFIGDYQRTFTRGSLSSIYVGNYGTDFVRVRVSNLVSMGYPTSTTLETSFTGNYTGNYSRDFYGVYVGEYVRTSTRTGTFDFTRAYAGLYTGNYTAEYVRYYTRGFTRDFAGEFVGNYARAYTRNSVNTSTRTSSLLYVGNYTGNYTADYIANYTRIIVDQYNRIIVDNYTRDFVGEYTRTSTRTSSRDFVGNYTRNITDTYSDNYTRDSVFSFVGDFTGDYTGNYVGDFSRNFVGNYVGATIQSSTEVYKTYTLWVRVE
jgi:hypothetical protein